MSQTPFSNLKLQTNVLQNLVSLNYTMMTAIQAQSLPHILAGKDVIAQSQTGSGKTAAFGLGLLEKLDVPTLNIQGLVLCPTRELADQVAKELRRLARNIANVKIITLCGGMPMRTQQASLRYGAHIIVGTPGRIEDHLKRGSLKLHSLQTLVLDEADRMLEMGFQVALESIVKQIPEQRQTLLFSATFQKKIQTIAKHIMQNPVMVKVALCHDNKSIKQYFYQVDSEQRLQALHLLLLQEQPESCLVFCNTKRETEEVAHALIYAGFSALALNGDLEQRERDQAIIRFANKSITILVATDVAARGLDIDALDLVVNYELAHEPETHVHRIGRTGRAGKQGLACSLLSTKDNYKMTVLGDYLEETIQASPLPPRDLLKKSATKAAMTTLQISGGKKHKIRPGDILGTLTAGNGMTGDQVGKIDVMDQWAYVAVNRSVASLALKKLGSGNLKGRSFRVSIISTASEGMRMVSKHIC